MQSLPEAKIEVTVGGESFVVESRFSTPKPEWVQGSNRLLPPRAAGGAGPGGDCRSRHVHQPDRGEPADHANVIRRSWATVCDRPGWRALSSRTRAASAGDPSNPTSLGVTEKCGVGLIALNDVFRIHIANDVANSAVGIADNEFVLKPNGQYTAEWAIVPVDAPDYWRFLNAARRLVDANFTIPGGFCFLRVTEPVAAWTEERSGSFLRVQGPALRVRGFRQLQAAKPLQGTAFQKVAAGPLSARPSSDVAAWRRR